jgi:hypothetical protein
MQSQLPGPENLIEIDHLPPHVRIAGSVKRRLPKQSRATSGPGE